MKANKSLAAKGALNFGDLDDTTAVPAAAPSPAAPSGVEVVDVAPEAPRVRSGVAAIGRSISVQQELHDTRAKLKAFEEAKVVQRLDPALIDDSAWRNRDARSFETKEFHDLKEEIARSGGNVQPVKVRPKSGGRFEIVFGRRRTRACLELGLPVNAVVDDLSDMQAYVEMVRENRDRKDLTAWEQGVMYDDAVRRGLFPSLRRMAEALGVQVSHASTACTLAQLPAEVLDAFPSPLDLQFRWAVPLKEALEADPEKVLREAATLRTMSPRPPAKLVFERLIGMVAPKATTRPLRRGKKTVGSLTTDPKGAMTLKIQPGALSADEEQKLVAYIRQLLS